MKRKELAILFLSSFILISITTIYISVDVSAATYDLDVEEDDSFTWEVTEVNVHYFEKVFGFEPNFEKGDETKRDIERIIDSTDGWKFTVKLWDFKIDKDTNGTIVYDDVPSSPSDYDENIFIPTPVNDFLSEAAEDLSSEYTVQGSRVTKEEDDFTMEKEYDQNGVLAVETYTDEDGIVLVKIEGNFRAIPSANVELIVGIMAISLAALVIVMIKRKKFNIKII